MSIEENLNRIRDNVAKSCQKVGRNPEDVLIVGVTKTRSPEEINEAIDCGITDIGENRVQELMSKYDSIQKGVRWHLIGRLQTNKVKYIADKVDMIHSVDNIKLAREIDRQCGKHGRVMDILIEVNSGEENKGGVAPKDLQGLIEEVRTLPNVRIMGLMTMAPLGAEESLIRKVFSDLRKLAVDIDEKKYDNVCMKHLSMGMSNDYTIACEEGATIIRPGRGIFNQK